MESLVADAALLHAAAEEAATAAEDAAIAAALANADISVISAVAENFGEAYERKYADIVETAATAKIVADTAQATADVAKAAADVAKAAADTAKAAAADAGRDDPTNDDEDMSDWGYSAVERSDGLRPWMSTGSWTLADQFRVLGESQDDYREHQ